MQASVHQYSLGVLDLLLELVDLLLLLHVESFNFLFVHHVLKDLLFEFVKTRHDCTDLSSEDLVQLEFGLEASV